MIQLSALSAKALSAKIPRPTLTGMLVTVLVLLQFPLWANEGGWGAVWRLERQIVAKQLDNDNKRQRVLELEAEVRDFKKSPRAAEERARYELGLVNAGERFLQWGSPPRQ